MLSKIWGKGNLIGFVAIHSTTGTTGRKRKIDRDKLLKYKEKGIIGTALAKEMGISRATVYKILKEEKNRAIVN